MKKLTKKDLKNINGGNMRFPDANGNCPAGWYLCPKNICINDRGGENPITPSSPYYTACFG
ncbi:bacteriocin [Chryseobacterium vrystaatense]|uniref:Bacteriocin-type signal sequence-containing protein n=1 Tax=Chryseobacterium vrystaatense TaxID=307480 RepID=A0A1M5MX00_9FLAO|nr:bacteriocin [Chryseobacterium vrystaatense]SHG81811.1 bacteriocin-type signal sequence-containing protein [Chryseobacterium vrystaatense]